MLCALTCSDSCLCLLLRRDALRTGKQLLREKSGPAAMVRFEKALMLSRALGDRVRHISTLYIATRCTAPLQSLACLPVL